MRKKTNVVKVLVSVVFTFAMAFGVMTAMPSGGVAAQDTSDGSTICQVSASGSFSTTSGDQAVCDDFESRFVSGGPCQIVVSGAGVVIDQGNCVFSDATVTAVPSVTVTTVPSVTVTTVPSVTVTETETAVPSETATETETAVVTETPVVTETEVVTETAVETETEVVPVETVADSSGGGGTDTTGGSGTGTDTSGGSGTGTDTSGGSDSGSSVSALPDTGTGSTDSSNTTFVALFGALAAVGVGGAYALRRRTR